MQISGNTILITGGGSGIGRGLAESFYNAGSTVIIAGRRQSVLDETTKANPDMESLVLDIERADSIEKFAAQLTNKYPALNAVIHNAGVSRPEDVKAGTDTKNADAIIATNLLGPIRLTAALLPHLLKQKNPAVITVSSGLAFMPLASWPTYCATKAAIHSWSQSLRYQLKETAVEVIEIIPPYVQTELGGPQQANDPRAMPLDAFVSETMELLGQPGATEVTVKNVLPMRHAERNGSFEQFFQKLNDEMSKR